MTTMFVALIFSFSANVNAPVFTVGEEKYKVNILTTELDRPWAVVRGPDNTLYLTEKAGKIFIYRDGKRVASLTGIPRELDEKGQGGLMDMAFHPQFKQNRFVYLSYITRENAIPSDGVNTRIARFRLVGNRLTDKKVLAQGGYGRDGAHFGSRMVFGADDKLYATFGERHNKEKSQDLKYLNGKVIRINDDGSIPQDNPFYNVPGARKEIFTFGHRNPQGIDVHPLNGSLVISEHGPSGYDAQLPTLARVGKADEINVLRPGGNYGWPWVFGSPDVLPWTEEMHRLVADKNLIMPLREYTVPDGIAPAGVAFYTGEKFPSWKNSFFVAALRGYLLRLDIDGENRLVKEEHLLPEGFSRIRDVTTGADGYLYVISDKGQLIQIVPQ